MRVEYYYRQNLLLFARGESMARLVKAGFTAAEPLDMAHRELHERMLSDLHDFGVRRAAAQFLTAVRSAVARRVKPHTSTFRSDQPADRTLRP
jgi:hypothetical protein